MPIYYTCSPNSNVTLVKDQGTTYEYLLCNPGQLQELSSDDLGVVVSSTYAI